MSATRRIVRRDAVDARGDWPASWPPLLRRVHAARGSDAREAMPRLVDLLPFAGMAGIDAAVELLGEAIDRKARILERGEKWTHVAALVGPDYHNYFHGAWAQRFWITVDSSSASTPN